MKINIPSTKQQVEIATSSVSWVHSQPGSRNFWWATIAECYAPPVGRSSAVFDECFLPVQLLTIQIRIKKCSLLWIRPYRSFKIHNKTWKYWNFNCLSCVFATIEESLKIPPFSLLSLTCAPTLPSKVINNSPIILFITKCRLPNALASVVPSQDTGSQV